MRRTMMKCCIVMVVLATVVLAGGWWLSVAQAARVDFEDLVLAPQSYWIGYDSQPYPADSLGEEHPFTSRGVELYNYYIEGYDPVWQSAYTYWEGWAYSNQTDTVTPGYGNQYSAIPGGGVAGSSNFGVAYLPETSDPSADAFRRVDVELAGTDGVGGYGLYVTNTTYDYYSIRDGDQFARKFGHTKIADQWVDTQEPDWFKLIITGLDATGAAVGGLDPVEFFLADYRYADSAEDYVIDDWTWVDLSGLVDGGAEQLQFVLDSSDKGAFGINTPLLVAIDAVPEPSTIAMIVCGALGLLVWRRRKVK